MNACLVFSGYNNRAVLSVCRTLERQKVPYFVLGQKAKDYLQYSRYTGLATKWLQDPALDIEEIKGHILALKESYKVDKMLVIPSTEYLNRFLLKHRDELEKDGLCIIPIVPEETYTAVSDKAKFAKLCDAADILIPQEFNLPPQEIEFPFVAKPKREFSSAGIKIYPYLIHTEKDRQGFLAKEETTDYFYQEYIHGGSYYLLCYCYKDGRVEYLLQQNGAQQPNGKSVVFAWSKKMQADIPSEKYVSLLKSINFYGIIMIEMKGTAGKYSMIEANPRIWGPTQLMLNSRLNLILCYLEEYLGHTKASSLFSPRYGQPYFWIGGIVDVLWTRGNLNWFEDGKATFFRKWWYIFSKSVYLRSDSLRIFLHEMKNTFKTK